MLLLLHLNLCNFSDSSTIFKEGKIRNRTGYILKIKIMDYKNSQIISKKRPLFQNKKYYDTWNQFFSDMNVYLNQEAESDGYEKRKKIIRLICIVAINLITLIVIILCYVKKYKKTNKIKEIKTFFNNNKNNYEIFKENCIICLNLLNNIQYQLKTLTNFNNTQQQNKTNENDISTLKCKCRHQYHNKCLTEKKINDFPICSKLNNPILNNNNEKIIWTIQQVLHPSLGFYDDNTNVKKKEIDDRRNGEHNYDAPSYVGGNLGEGSCGGGSVGRGNVGNGGDEGSF